MLAVVVVVYDQAEQVVPAAVEVAVTVLVELTFLVMQVVLIPVAAQAVAHKTVEVFQVLAGVQV
jgi:hypothetical protein